MSFGADWTCSCGWANLDVRPKCRNCGAANPNYTPVTRKPASSPAGGDVQSFAIKALYQFADLTARHWQNKGKGGPGLEAEMEKAEQVALDAIAALSPSTSAAEPVAMGNGLSGHSEFTPITVRSSTVPAAVKSYQARVGTACAAVFDGDPTDVSERRDRFAEEALETCQAFGMTREDMHALVDYTFSRPIGDPAKEIGASMTTLASLCVYSGHDLMACAETDLAKLQQPETIARIRSKRATRHGRGPLPGLSEPAAVESAQGVKVKDWLAVAKAAGQHGIRYRTNRALEAFLSDVRASLATEKEG